MNRTDSHGDITCTSNHHEMGKFVDSKIKLGDLQLALRRSIAYNNSFTSSF